MRNFIRNLRASFNSIRESVFNALFRARFRYDVFISYSHSDARQYAENLKQQLGNLDFACFIDKEESPPGLALGPTLEKALKKSAVLVLLATERALTRPYIEMEFEGFITAKRKIIPINIAGALNGEVLTRNPWNVIEQQKLIWIGSVALSRDGKLLAAGRFNKSVSIWAIDNDTPLTTYDGFSENVFSLAFAPDGKILITYDDKTLIQHSTNPPYQKVNEVLTNEKIGCVSFSADGKKLLAGVSTNKIRIMGWPDWRDVRLREAPGTPSGSACPHALSGDGETLATLHDNNVFLLDVQSWSTLGSFNPGGQLWDLVVTPDGKKIAARDSATIKLWDIRDVQNQATIYTGNAVEQIAFANSGQMFATFGDNKVNIWDSQMLKQLPGLKDPDWNATAMAFSSAGRIATGSENGTLRLWNMETRAPSLVLTACSKILSLSFAPDEQTIAVGCTSGNVELWDVTRGQRLKTLAGHTGPVRTLQFSAAGQLASGSEDGTVRLWEASSGRQLWSGKHQDGILGLAFSSDGKRLASASKDKTVKIWQVSGGNDLLTLVGHKFEVSAVAFSPDGKTLATGGEDKLVKLWDSETGQELVSFPDHTSRVTSVTFSPDGKTLATGSWDRTLKLWFAAPEKP